MAQLHLYVPEEVADRLRKKAGREGVSLSKYLASVVSREADESGWPGGYFERVLGAWKGELARPPQGKFEQRESFD